MYCPNCGNLIQEGKKFCASCGARIEPSADAAAPQQPAAAPEQPVERQAAANAVPYREKVEQDLEAARRAQRKSGPVTMIVCLLIGALFGVNAYFLIAQEKGIYLRFLGVGGTGIICALMALFLLAAAVYSIVNTLKNCSNTITEKRFARFMDEVCAVGPENEVFARIDRLTPYAFGKSELRFDETLITCTSTTEPDVTFIAPLSALVEAGRAVAGNKNATTSSLYLHVMQNGRKRKISSNAEQGEIMEVLAALQALRPDLKIMNAGKPL